MRSRLPTVAAATLVALTLPACCGDDVACEDGVSGGSRLFPPGPFHIRVTLCRNDACDEVTLDQNSQPVAFSAGGPGSVSGATSGGLGDVMIFVDWFLQDLDIDDGDRYRVAVFDLLANEPLYDVEKKVAYKTVQCSCQRAELGLPNLPG